MILVLELRWTTGNYRLILLYRINVPKFVVNAASLREWLITNSSTN
jgi:hypothetical protein